MLSRSWTVVRSRQPSTAWIQNTKTTTRLTSQSLAQLPGRLYHATSARHEDAAEASVKNPPIDKAQLKAAAREFNHRRASYRRQVSEMRKEYAHEVAQQRAADLAEREARQKAATRKRLERQRRKNIRSAQNALRQEHLRQEQAARFQEHLDKMQRKRETEHARYTKARQKVVDEMEAVCHLWLTSPEEVEAAFTRESEQLLWAFPGGVLGETNPSIDTHFWQHETHIWHMFKTYKAQREVLLEKLEETVYENANIDPKYWTPERLAGRQERADKARLRAMVKAAGQQELLRRQHLMMEESAVTSEFGVVESARPPSNNLLRNERAQEAEGAKMLLENPTRFFVFDDNEESGTSSALDEEEQQAMGMTLGSPKRLRDPLRDNAPGGTVFPEVVGKFMKPDMRTEREKKQHEREQRMLAAAHAEAQGDLDIELAAQQQTVDDLEPDLDYNNHEWDSDDEEWEKGLDPVADKGLLELSKDKRYSDADLEWVAEQLDNRVKHFEQQFKQDMDDLKQRTKSEIALSLGEGEEMSELEVKLLSLSGDQLFVLSDLDENYQDMNAEEVSEALATLGLSEEEAELILQRER